MLRGFGRPSAVPAPAPTSAPTPSASSGSGPWRRSAEAPQSAAPAEQSQRYSPRALERAPPQARAHFSFAPEAAGPRSARPRPGPLSLEAALGCLLPSAEASPPASARGPRPGDPGGGSRTSPSGARFDGRSLDFAALCSRVIVMQRPWTLKLATNLDIHRNNVNDVADFLSGNFDKRYQIFSIAGGPTLSREESAKGFVEFRDQALLFRVGESSIKPPPPVSLLSGFCSSVMFWLNLERRRNFCVLQISEHASAAALLFFVALFLALGLAPSASEALAQLEGRCGVEPGARRRTSTITWIDQSHWSPSLRRYLGYVETLCTKGALLARPAAQGRAAPDQETSRVCIMLIDVKRFAKSVEDDIEVEVYAATVDEGGSSIDFHLVTDEHSYAPQHSSPEDGMLILDMAPEGKPPLWVQGDVAIIVKSAGRPHICCRYFFNTDFVEIKGTDYLLLTKDDFDIDKESQDMIPEDLMVGIVVSSTSDSKPGPSNPAKTSTQTDGALAIARKAPVLPHSKPAADKAQFSQYHLVDPDPSIFKELVDGGYNPVDVRVALQVTRNSLIDTVDFLSRHFPMSAQGGASRLASWALSSGPQAMHSPRGSDTTPSDVLSDRTTLREASMHCAPSSVIVPVRLPPEVPPVAQLERPRMGIAGWPFGSWGAKRSAPCSTRTSTSAGSALAQGLYGAGFDSKPSSAARPPPAAHASQMSPVEPSAHVAKTPRDERLASAPPQAAPAQTSPTAPRWAPQPLALPQSPGCSAAPTPRESAALQDAQLLLPQQRELRKPPKALGAPRQRRAPQTKRPTFAPSPPMSRTSSGGAGPLGGPWPAPMPKPPSGCPSAMQTPRTDAPAPAAATPMPRRSGSPGLGEAPRSARGDPPLSARVCTPSSTGRSKAPPVVSPPKGAKSGSPPPKAPEPPEEPKVEGKLPECGAEATAAPAGKGKGAPPAPALGKGKGKGGGPALPGAKPPPPAPGKAGPPAPKGKGTAPKGKAKGALTPKAKGGFGASATAPAVLPLGRKLHWKPISEQNLENTVWAQINAEDAVPNCAFDLSDVPEGIPVEVLERLFKSAGKDSTSVKAKAGARKKLTILDNKRAQNVAIMMHGLGFDAADLKDRLSTLNVQNLSYEGLMQCREILPTEEEVERLAAYRGDIALMRDVEQKLHPLATMSRLQQRVRLMIFAVQLPQISREIHTDIATLVAACKQVRESNELKKVLLVVLRLGNFVNHGARDSQTKQTKGFSVEALPKLAEMKSPVSPSITMLHYVAYTRIGGLTPSASLSSFGGAQKGGVVAEPKESRQLQDELGAISEASRVVPSAIQKMLETLNQETAFVGQELKFPQKYEPEALTAMQDLQRKAETILDGLTAAYSECERHSQDLLHFFGEDPRQRTVNTLLETLQDFVEVYCNAARELRRQPKKFELLMQPPADTAVKTTSEKCSSPKAVGEKGGMQRRYTVAASAEGKAAVAAEASDVEKQRPDPPKKLESNSTVASTMEQATDQQPPADEAVKRIDTDATGVDRLVVAAMVPGKLALDPDGLHLANKADMSGSMSSKCGGSLASARAEETADADESSRGKDQGATSGPLAPATGGKGGQKGKGPPPGKAGGKGKPLPTVPGRAEHTAAEPAPVVGTAAPASPCGAGVGDTRPSADVAERGDAPPGFALFEEARSALRALAERPIARGVASPSLGCSRQKQAELRAALEEAQAFLLDDAGGGDGAAHAAASHAPRVPPSGAKAGAGVIGEAAGCCEGGVASHSDFLAPTARQPEEPSPTEPAAPAASDSATLAPGAVAPEPPPERDPEPAAAVEREASADGGEGIIGASALAAPIAATGVDSVRSASVVDSTRVPTCAATAVIATQIDSSVGATATASEEGVGVARILGGSALEFVPPATPRAGALTGSVGGATSVATSLPVVSPDAPMCSTQSAVEPEIFAIDSDDSGGDSDASFVEDEEPRMQRQNSLDERYDAFEAMSRACLVGEERRRQSVDIGASVQVQAFDMGQEEESPHSNDDGGIKRSNSFDWQYDALDCGSAIAAVAAASAAGRPEAPDSFPSSPSMALGQTTSIDSTMLPAPSGLSDSREEGGVSKLPAGLETGSADEDAQFEFESDVSSFVAATACPAGGPPSPQPRAGDPRHSGGASPQQPPQTPARSGSDSGEERLAPGAERAPVPSLCVDPDGRRSCVGRGGASECADADTVASEAE